VAWYVQDEVGSVTQHSDTPNVKVMTFFNSPGKALDDPNQFSVNVLWPVKDINPQDTFFRDYLRGFTEKQFRSARLHTWFDVPVKYFEEQLKLLRTVSNP